MSLTISVARKTQPEGGEAKLDVKFENTTSWASEKEWDFGDKSPAELIIEEDTVSHKYLEKGTYSAILTVTDDKGCFDTDTILIEVLVEPSKLENVPNVFTPNGDGINDFFKFSEENLKGMKEFHMTIYNRWGQKVYETYNTEAEEISWDGKNKLGFTVSPGVYYYVITAEGKDDKIYKGDRGSKKDKQQTTTPDENTISTGAKGIIHVFR